MIASRSTYLLELWQRWRTRVEFAVAVTSRVSPQSSWSTRALWSNAKKKVMGGAHQEKSEPGR